jgi:hypothetical protein
MLILYRMFGRINNSFYLFLVFVTCELFLRDEIISEYDAKMRDANEREEQFRKRVQPNTTIDTPKEVQASLSTVSSASSSSFHTPAIDQSPNTVPIIDNKLPIVSSPLNNENSNDIDTLDLMPITPKEATQTLNNPIIRHTANEETTQAEYRSTVKMVPSNVLKSTIQNYMTDHRPLDDDQGK